MWRYVATIAGMTTTGIRELKNHLSRYVRRIERGERIAVTAHGRVVAEIGPPAGTDRTSAGTRLDQLVAAGIVRPPRESGDPLEDWPDLDLPAGTASRLIDGDRGEA
jgi:prevent-host-death family protein